VKAFNEKKKKDLKEAEGKEVARERRSPVSARKPIPKLWTLPILHFRNSGQLLFYLVSTFQIHSLQLMDL